MSPEAQKAKLEELNEVRLPQSVNLILERQENMVEKNRKVGPPEPGTPVEPHKITRTPLTQILDEMDANIRAAAEAAARAEQAAKAAKEAAGAATKASDQARSAAEKAAEEATRQAREALAEAARKAHEAAEEAERVAREAAGEATKKAQEIASEVKDLLLELALVIRNANIHGSDAFVKEIDTFRDKWSKED